MQVLQVSQLNRYIKSLLDENQLIQDIFIQGEISNLTAHQRSGHLYFTLKDEKAAIRAVMFASYAKLLPFLPTNGMRVIARGSVTLYERDGAYQLYAVDMQPDGLGALYLAYEQLKDKLAAQGLFDPARKRPLPPYPRRIGVVTSPNGAALQDILQILARRYPLAEVFLAGAQVQGQGAAASICRALELVCRPENGCQLVIVGRGGGSLEDLWPFNEETVVRAVAACPAPVISAVGHETDVTLCDLAADLRAPTPSAAAELAVPDGRELLMQLAGNEQSLQRQILQLLSRREEALSKAAGRLKSGFPLAKVARQEERLTRQRALLALKMRGVLDSRGQALARQAAVLDSLSPLRVLARGYSITLGEDGRPLTNAGQAAKGDRLRTQLARGWIESTVVKTGEERAE